MIFGFLASLFGGFPLSGRTSSFKPEESLHVVREVGETYLGLSAGDANRAHEQAHAVLLVTEDVLNLGADLGFGGVGFAHSLGHGFSLGLLAVDLGDEATFLQEGLVPLRAVARIRPHGARCVFLVEKFGELLAVV